MKKEFIPVGKSKETKERFCVMLSPSVQAKAKAMAEKYNISVSELIGQLIAQFC